MTEFLTGVLVRKIKSPPTCNIIVAMRMAEWVDFLSRMMVKQGWIDDANYNLKFA